METKHADEMKMLNQLFTQNQNEKNQIEREMKNKVAALELEIKEKTNVIAGLMAKQNSISKEIKRCEECERLLSLIKEMENQIEFYKQSALRKRSQFRAEPVFDNSDYKSYAKE